jgi:hypothetical protein
MAEMLNEKIYNKLKSGIQVLPKNENDYCMCGSFSKYKFIVLNESRMVCRACEKPI